MTGSPTHRMTADTTMGYGLTSSGSNMDPKPDHVLGVFSPLLGTMAPHIRHGFLTRRAADQNGVPIDFSLRRIGQDPERLMGNRRIGARFFAVDPAFFLYPHQVHGHHVHIVTGSYDGAVSQPTADALVTTTPGIVIGVITADCVPVLLCDPTNQVIGAIHAGWRGACARIVEHTVTAMAALGAKPSLIRAAIGPAIQQPTYEVSRDVYDAFVSIHEKAQIFFHHTPFPDHFLLDLPGFVAGALEHSGIPHDHIDRLKDNTYDTEKDFHSCRRSAHRGDTTFGCQFSGLMIKPPPR